MTSVTHTVKYRTSHLIRKLNIPYQTDPWCNGLQVQMNLIIVLRSDRRFVVSGFSALKLPAQTGAGVSCPLSECARDALAHGHHLGRGQSADHVPAQHG